MDLFDLGASLGLGLGTARAYDFGFITTLVDIVNRVH
jgi:hypothetical protein